MNFTLALIVFIISTKVSLIITETVDPDKANGVLNLHDYYTCYFNKYFNVSPAVEDERRDKVSLHQLPDLLLHLLVVRDLRAGVCCVLQPEQSE